MILTDKALKDFLMWKSSNNKLSTIEIIDFRHLSKTSKNAIIIDWFDSVGIVINVSGVICNGIKSFNLNIQQNNTLNGDEYNNFKSRKGAIIAGIDKANKIYNSRFK